MSRRATSRKFASSSSRIHAPLQPCQQQQQLKKHSIRAAINQNFSGSGKKKEKRAPFFLSVPGEEWSCSTCDRSVFWCGRRSQNTSLLGKETTIFGLWNGLLLDVWQRPNFSLESSLAQREKRVWILGGMWDRICSSEGRKFHRISGTLSKIPPPPPPLPLLAFINLCHAV